MLTSGQSYEVSLNHTLTSGPIIDGQKGGYILQIWPPCPVPRKERMVVSRAEVLKSYLLILCSVIIWMCLPTILGHPFSFANYVLSAYDGHGNELVATKTQRRVRHVSSTWENRTLRN